MKETPGKYNYSLQNALSESPNNTKQRREYNKELSEILTYEKQKT